ncbi:hypothetical protein BKN78_05005 [Salmonella enterica]|nr:hypothetical protein [Salmonella enterica]EAZ0562326.1 hypothetical protein [Salmonella enterica]
MKIIYDDESISGYLFRCLSVYGINAFESAIGNNGCWHSLPAFPCSLAPFLRMVPDRKLFMSLQREGHFNFAQGKVDNPMRIIELLKSVYGGSSKSTNYKGDNPILYCPLCFKEMIKKYGHAYFKSIWGNKSNCFVHQTPLMSLTGKNVKESVRNIKYAMTEESLSKYSGEIKMNAVDNANPVELIEPESLKFLMPCTYNATYVFVREYYSYNSKKLKFKSYLYDRMFYSSFSSKMNGIFAPMMKRVDSNIIYAALNEVIELDYNAYLSFVRYSMQYKKFSFGFNQHKSLTVTVVKNANKNCSKCYERRGSEYCVFDSVIKKASLGPKLSCINLCDFRLMWGKDCLSLYLEKDV